MSFATRAIELLNELGTGPVLVHSDPFRTARLVEPARQRHAFLDSHIELIRTIAREHDVWMPAFNYDFPRSGVFHTESDPVQIGPLPERFRTAFATWRTPVPMFSVSGTGADPEILWNDRTDPFGGNSIFARLVESDGIVLYYGETFSYNTIVHYAERLYGGPPYRYDKLFPGRVLLPGGEMMSGTLSCHVRPMGKALDYDWPRLLAEALRAGTCRRVEGNPEVLAASARVLSDFWVATLARDPLALLDDPSRAWAEPALEKLGRRFTIGDFEAEPAPRAFVRAL